MGTVTRLPSGGDVAKSTTDGHDVMKTDGGDGGGDDMLEKRV